MKNDNQKKLWVTPEIRRLTEFDVHENVVATSETPLDFGTSPDRI